MLGVIPADVDKISTLIGEKLVLTEVVAYMDLAKLLGANALASVITSYSIHYTKLYDAIAITLRPVYLALRHAILPVKMPRNGSISHPSGESRRIKTTPILMSLLSCDVSITQPGMFLPHHSPTTPTIFTV